MYVEEYQEITLSYPEEMKWADKFKKDKDWKLVSDGTAGSVWRKITFSAQLSSKEQELAMLGGNDDDKKNNPES